jgi:hypothetical protein
MGGSPEATRTQDELLAMMAVMILPLLAWQSCVFFNIAFMSCGFVEAPWLVLTVCLSLLELLLVFLSEGGLMGSPCDAHGFQRQRKAAEILRIGNLVHVVCVARSHTAHLLMG